MFKHSKSIFVAFLVGVTLFSVFKYLTSLKERYDLLNSIKQFKSQVEFLEIQKQNLVKGLQQERELKQKLQEENTNLTSRLSQLDTDFAQAQQNIDRLSFQISLLRTENLALRDQDVNLRQALTQITQDRDNLKVRLSSIPELKKAIREVKIQMRQAALQVKERKKKTEISLKGNGGYLVKDGRATHPLNVNIEVIPLPVK